MGTSLFDAPVFGPVNSRRLGVSLGVNLLPADGKVCSFNCLYCECGLNEERRSKSHQLPSRELVKDTLDARLSQMKAEGKRLDVITFAGNGEPTIHPDFASIIDDTIALRNKYYPEVKLSVLSNAAHLDRPDVFEALKKVDNNILKLDSAIESTFRIINGASSAVKFENIIPHLSKFGKGVIIQTLFCKGEYRGQLFDNTSDEEFEALLKAYQQIKPAEIMIYSLARDTPVDTIYAVERKNLEELATKLRQNGFIVEVA